MKKKVSFFVVLLFLMGLSVVAQNKNPKYDKAYADSLGADENVCAGYFENRTSKGYRQSHLR
jgi:hypothetical protein